MHIGQFWIYKSNNDLADKKWWWGAWSSFMRCCAQVKTHHLVPSIRVCDYVTLTDKMGQSFYVCV